MRTLLTLLVIHLSQNQALNASEQLPCSLYPKAILSEIYAISDSPMTSESCSLLLDIHLLRKEIGRSSYMIISEQKAILSDQDSVATLKKYGSKL